MASWDFFGGVHKNSDWAFVWGCRAANANVGYGQSHPYFRLAERFWLLHLNPAQFSSQKNPLFIEKSPELTNMFFLFFFLDGIWMMQHTNPRMFVFILSLRTCPASICHCFCLHEQCLPATWTCWLLQVGRWTLIMDRYFNQKAKVSVSEFVFLHV